MSKKIQSQIRTAVTSFEKLVLSWQSDSNEIHQLLIAIRQLSDQMLSIDRYFQSRESIIFQAFPDLRQKLQYQLQTDQEDLYRQVKIFRTRLGDVAIAMQFKCAETLAIVTDQDPQNLIFEDEDCGLEDVLSIQRLTVRYSSEHKRKEDLLREVLSTPRADSLERASLEWPDDF